jgi:dTMP kinase
MAAGQFITFEGGEGSGKSTQAKLLAEKLKARGFDVVVTREPGGSPFAERLRTVLLDPETPPHSPLSEALLFYAARADHLETVIRPSLQRGAWVICDRFSDSTRVYQSYAGSLSPRVVEALDLLVVNHTTPDLTLIIDVPADLGLARAEVRAREKNKSAIVAPTRPGQDKPSRDPSPLLSDRYEARTSDFHYKLREGFLDIAKKAPDRCTVVDGQLDQEMVAKAVWAAVAVRLLNEAA